MGRLNCARAFARIAMRGVLLAAVMSLVSCAGDEVLGDYPPSTCDLAEPPAEFRNVPLTIATFWTGDTHERAAFETLKQRVDYPAYFPEPQEMRSRVDVQTRLYEAFNADELPDVFQVNGGSDVLRWVEGRQSDETAVCALNSLRDQHDWDRAYFDSALAPSRCDGNLYALPIGVHHLNVLFYNHRLFDELSQLASERGLELLAPSELTSLEALMSQLQLIDELGYETASGKPLLPLAVGTLDAWPLTIIAFENVLLSLHAQAYEHLWMGGPENATAERRAKLESALRDMLAALRRLRDFADFEARLSWQDAVRQVGAGDAFVTITGDWGWAQFEQDQIGHVSTATFPGTAGNFVYTPDSFAVPRDMKKHGGFPSRSFLRDVVADKETLIAFSNQKHAIPPRLDLDDADLDRLTAGNLRSTYEEFKRCHPSNEGCKLLLAVSGLGPPPGFDPCFDQIDALLTLAVWGEPPSEDAPLSRPCDGEPFPETAAEAETRLINLLLRVSQQRFASGCR